MKAVKAKVRRVTLDVRSINYESCIVYLVRTQAVDLRLREVEDAA